MTEAPLPPEQGNLYADLPVTLVEEVFQDLLSTPGLRLERIVSRGQTTPPGEWLEQDNAEWVLLLRGAAQLSFAGEDKTRMLCPGDYVHIPAHRRHRVEWTSADGPTVWLALHYTPASD